MTTASSQAPGRVVFVNRFYWPDHSATAQILCDLATGLAALGWEVTVITSRLRYEGGDRLAPVEEHGGVTIQRVATSRFGRTTLVGRAIDYASFYVSAMIAAFRIVRRGDILVAKTDPPLLQIPLTLVSHLRGASQVNWMQDVYPELAVALGMHQLAGLPARLLVALRSRSMRGSARTVAIGGRMKEMLVAAGARRSQIVEIHNWGDDAVLGAPREPSELRETWGFTSQRLVVGYSGNLGRAHELATMLDVSRVLAAQAALVDFLFIGGGALRERLDAAALPNIALRPYQPRDELFRSMGVADIHWLSLQPELEGLIVPSKFYGSAASGRPILFIGDEDGEVARLIRRHDCGWTFRPGETQAIATLLRDLAADRDQLLARGCNARRMVRNHFSRAKAISAWDALLREVAG